MPNGKLAVHQQALLKYATGLDEIIPEGLTHAHRLFIYRNGFVARVHDALAETYPHTMAALDLDDGLVERFARGHNFPGFSLSDVCDDFPDYLMAHVSDSETLLLAVAKYEQQIVKSFHAEHSEPMATSAFVNALRHDPESLSLSLQPHVFINTAHWRLQKICGQWSTMLANSGEKLKVANEVRTEQLFYQLIYRKNWQVYILEISDQQAFLLQCLGDGTTIDAACCALEHKFASAWLEGEAPPIESWLMNWVALGLFSQKI